MARRPSPTPAPPTPPRPPRPPAGPRARRRQRRRSRRSGAEAQLALCEPDHLRRLEQPLKYGFADRSSARKGLEVAAGVAIADRLGSIRQTAGPPIGRHGYMAIVWLGSRWLQLEQAAASAVPVHPVPAAARLRLGGVRQERPPGPQADAPEPPGGALGGRGQRLGQRQEDPRGPLRDHRPGAVAGGPGRAPRAARLHLPRQLVPRAAAPRGRRLHRLGRAARPPPHRPQALRPARERPLRGRARTARSGRPTGWVPPSLRASARPAPASATTWPRWRAPARRSRAIRAPATASPASGSRSTATWCSSWSCGARPGAPAGACPGCCAAPAG